MHNTMNRMMSWKKRSTRRCFSGALLFLLSTPTLAVYAKKASSSPTSKPTTQASSKPAVRTSKSSTRQRVQSRVLPIHLRERHTNTPAFVVDVRYPQIVAMSDHALRRVNKTIGRWIDHRRARFRREMMDHDHRTTTTHTRPHSLRIRYRVDFESRRLLSLLFEARAYYQGTAHDNLWFRTFTFDLKRGRVITLPELFPRSAPFLQTLSTHATAQLHQKKVLLFKDGASPKRNNFRCWTITSQGLSLHFPPYQVAPYVVGPQEVKILKDVITWSTSLRSLWGMESR